MQLKALDLEPASYHVSHSNMFFRAGVLTQLEEEGDIKLAESSSPYKPTAVATWAATCTMYVRTCTYVYMTVYCIC